MSGLADFLGRPTLARRLASALASQIDAVVPSGVRVAAEGTVVAVGDDRAAARTDVGLLLEEDAAIAARAVLDSVQDFVTETLTVPWPPTDEPSRLPPPHALWSGDRLRLFYGDPDDPVLELPGVSAAELEG